MKTYALTTLGCHKNQADSRQMERSLRASGFRAASHPESADVHLINSCAFVESAREETIRVVLEAADLKHTASQKLVLVGCFSERYAQAITEELPEVDYCFGTGLYHKAGEMLIERFGAPGPLIASFDVLKTNNKSDDQQIWAPLKISDGCNRSCAFCAIPLMRGKFKSLDTELVLQEARLLAGEGIRELCLVSQDTNQFGGSVTAFISLLAEIQKIPGLSWIRLLYMYPDPRTLDIYEQLAKRHEFDKLVPYLESPVQHVSSRVLKSMRRYGSYQQFVEFFGRIREIFPELEVRTSFMCGFPGETEKDVEQLMEFIREVKPEKLSLFSYSHEEGTTGYELEDSISVDEKSLRINNVREVHLQVLAELHKKRVGSIYECMVDRIDLDKTMVVRRAQDAPEIDELVFVSDIPEKDQGLHRPGDLLKVRVNGFYEYDMTGELV